MLSVLRRVVALLLSVASVNVFAPPAPNLNNHFGLSVDSSASEIREAVAEADRFLSTPRPPLDRGQQQRLLEFARLVTESDLGSAEVPILDLETLMWGLNNAVELTVIVPEFMRQEGQSRPPEMVGTLGMHNEMQDLVGTVVRQTLRLGRANPDEFLECVRRMSFRLPIPTLMRDVIPVLWDADESKFLPAERFGQAPLEFAMAASRQMDTTSFKTFVATFGTLIAHAEAKLGFPSSDATRREMADILERLSSSERRNRAEREERSAFTLIEAHSRWDRALFGSLFRILWTAAFAAPTHLAVTGIAWKSGLLSAKADAWLVFGLPGLIGWLSSSTGIASVDSLRVLLARDPEGFSLINPHPRVRGLIQGVLTGLACATAFRLLAP